MKKLLAACVFAALTSSAALADTPALQANDMGTTAAFGEASREAQRGHGNWTCEARNIRGESFVSRGIILDNVQERALARCRAVSLVCHISHCSR